MGTHIKVDRFPTSEELERELERVKRRSLSRKQTLIKTDRISTPYEPERKFEHVKRHSLSKKRTITKADIPTSAELDREFERVQRSASKNRRFRGIISVMLVVSAAVVFLTTYFFPVFKVSGGSMSPTLQDGDIFITLKSREAEPGEICYFYSDNQIFCKRIIAVAGDIVDIDADGNVFVNGVILDEPYLADKTKGECDIELPLTVPEDSYFVMGDHRGTSLDSRYTEIGCIPRERIAGVLMFRLWPFIHIGDIN